jgi:ABC-type multidrug transport system fused ATPase/permease subunit
MALTSLERLNEYQNNLPVEPQWEVHGDSQIVKDAWPQQGKIDFENAVLQYRPSLPPALKNVTFTIEGGQSVGVIGRTGAGKSSLINLLFRINELTSGAIYIDGVDIAQIGLKTLRMKLSIIPQDPLLLPGTVRYNLDPFGKHPLSELLKTLQSVGMAADMLEADVGQGGENLSSGQKQLVSFARSLLARAQVVVMDEPTSNIDMETDEFLQDLVRREFASRTLITIAHRLNTIIDYDLILVMGHGELLELGPPTTLLGNPRSHLTHMVEHMGDSAAAALRVKAHQAMMSKSPSAICAASPGGIGQSDNSISVVRGSEM